jgi:L-rhamnose mutarotase
MFSMGLVMKLRGGAYAEYKEAHDNLWPSLAQGMHDNHVNMAIYLFGDRLFVHATAPTEAHWLASREDPELDRWHQYMATLLEIDDHGEIAFEQLPEAFAFGEFARE